MSVFEILTGDILFITGVVPISCEELFLGVEEKRRSAGAGQEYLVYSPSDDLTCF